MTANKTETEPEQRNQYDEPLCDECGTVIVDKENCKFGDKALCKMCQKNYENQLENIKKIYDAKQ